MATPSDFPPPDDKSPIPGFDYDHLVTDSTIGDECSIVC